MSVEASGQGGREHRIGARYPARLVGKVSVTGTSRFRRRKVEDLDVIVSDISVAGAAIFGPADSPLGSVVGGSVIELLIHDHKGSVRVRHTRRRDRWVFLGVEFLDLSPELEEVLYAAVGHIRDHDGTLPTTWTTAR
ncbi:MAG: PilZ domain-containing protein [Actinomycetota bacterium]